MGGALGPELSLGKVLEHAQPFGHAHLTLWADVGCMCVGASVVEPKRRAPQVSQRIGEHQEESIASSHEPRRSGRLLASSELLRQT